MVTMRNGTAGGPAEHVPSSRQRRATVLVLAVVGSLLVSMLALVRVAAPGLTAPRLDLVRPAGEVRTTSTSEFGLPAPRGIAYDPASGALLVAGGTGDSTRVLMITPGQDVLGSFVLPDAQRRTLAFDPETGVAAMLDGQSLVSRPVDGASGERGVDRTRLGALGVGDPAGATFDADGNLLILDAAGPAIVRVSGTGADRNVTRIRLAGLPSDLRGIAFNRQDGRIYVMSPSEKRVYALDDAGRLRRTYSLKSVRLDDPTGITFAPSADTTDDPARLNLFVADSGTSRTFGGVTEVTLAAAVTAADVPNLTANLIQTIATSTFNPPSPDPAGIAYLPGPDGLMIADSEVDEVTGAGYHGVNMWQITRSGSVSQTWTTLGYTKEPTGLGFDPGSNTLFISSDDNGRVYVVKRGPDLQFGTADDVVTSVNTTAYGLTDTEDPEYDEATGALFFLDGVSTEVYRVDPVNGIFGDADDVMSHFDVGQYGATDVEALGSDTSRGTLLVGDRSQRKIYEVTKSGDLTRIIDVRVPGMLNLSGLAMAPASDNSGHMNYWTVDRAVDNGPDPTENDGMIFELSLTASGNQAPSVDSVTIDQASPKTNDTLTVTVSASDPDNDPLTLSYQWSKNGVAIPGAVNPTLDLSAAGNGDKGDLVSVRVTAFDGQAQGARSSAQVTIINSPPVFAQDLGDRSDAAGAAVAISAGATDADVDPLAYDATGLPPGVAIDPTTGAIEGTIDSGAAAGSPYDVSVTVTDDASGQNPPPPPPVALVQRKATDQSATAGNTITLTYDSPPAQGDLLVGIGTASANRTPTIPAGWSLAMETGSGAETVVFYRIAGANEPSAVTYSVSGADVFMGLAIFEYSGLEPNQSTVLDRTVFTTGSSVVSVSTGTTPLTSQADELLLASVNLNSSRTFSNGWTNGFAQKTVTRRNTVADNIVSQAGQFETTESWNTSVTTAVGAMVTFKRAGSTTPDPDPNPGSATDTFTWTVTSGGPNTEPVVDSVTIDRATPQTNDTLTAQVVAHDDQGDPLTYTYQWSKGGVPLAGANAPTLDLSVVGNGDKGDAISVAVTASDAEFTTAPVASPEVVVVNSPPSFNQDLADQVNIEGDVVSVSAAATDPDGDALTYEATNLPTGLSIDGATGLISGTVAAGASATSPYSTAVTVREGATTDATDTLTWRIDAPVSPPPGLGASVTSIDVRLAWSASTSPNLAGYNVYRAAAADGPYTKLNGAVVTTTSYADATAPRGTSYYRVTGVDTVGRESLPASTSALRTILFRSLAQASARNVSSLSVPRPSGVVTGDLLVATIALRGSPAINTPSGWTLVRTQNAGTTMRQAVFYKIAITSDVGGTTPYVWTFSSSTSSTTGAIVRYEGASGASPIDVSSTQANSSSRSITAPAVTTSGPNTLLVGFFGIANGSSITPASGMLEQTEARQPSGSNKVTIEIADQVLPLQGGTGQRVAVASSRAVNIGQLIALRPA